MPKSKHRKNHKKKVNARRARLQSEKNRIEKVQQRFYQQMLKEIEEGKFDNTEELPTDENVITDVDVSSNPIQLEGDS